MNRTVTFASGLLLVLMIGFLLVIGRSLLIPLVIAIFIWHLLNTVNGSLRQIPLIRKRLRPWWSRLLSLIIVLIFVLIVVNIISNNVVDVINAAPRYQENLSNILTNLSTHYNIKKMPNLDSFLASVSVQSVLINIYAVFTTITSSAVLIIFYVVFLFVEQLYFRQKLQALFPQPAHRELIHNILTHIVNDTQKYLGLKTALSLITAVTSWLIMKYVKLDFAEFWALLIFFLNFIPNIGAIIATAFPAVLALIQFDSWFPFFFVTIGIVTIEFIVGNWVEPRYMSKSLNVSPLIILVALALWGSIWGVLGMFLSVPITVMMMIVFAHFEKTRPIAILLSQDGRIQNAYEKVD